VQKSTRIDIGLDWPSGDIANVPYAVFTDPALYTLEQERIYRGPTWSYVGLEAEIPREGDYKTTFIGEVPVILCRDRKGGVNVLVNRCAHRGALVLREAFGSRKRYNCVYHQWSYDPTGALKTVPFMGGVDGEGGYDPSFCLASHGLTRLRVETLGGLVFATFKEEAPPLGAYLGGTLPHVSRVFDGRPLVVLGYLRQLVRANWKLYFENTKDPYHAGLLHLFVATFGLFRSTQRGSTLSEPSGVGVLVSHRGTATEDKDRYEREKIATYDRLYRLNAPELMRTQPEFGDDVAVSIHTLFPSLVNHQIANSIATRHVIPKGVDSFELIWTLIGYADDPPELRDNRILQANLVGPAGYISLEDVEALEIIQRGIQGGARERSLIQLGGEGCPFGEPVKNLVNESAIRGFWRSWRALMEI
jgi:anthranilate 1,2-dioxygenase large subunit